jgi:hydroxymethylglutaryl-CoA lyase
VLHDRAKPRDPGAVVIREVGPRDGLQSVSADISTVDKVRLITELDQAGIGRMEVGSFVSRRAVPQMADTAEVVAATLGMRARREALVVSTRGARDALESGIEQLVVVVAASDRFSRANVRQSTEEALATAGEIVSLASGRASVVGDVATAFGCAYDGAVALDRVVSVAVSMRSLGIDEITLCDTNGYAAPADVGRLVSAVAGEIGSAATVGLHFHNTRGLGLANVWAGLEAGVRLFDASVGGIGGCPFSPGATGNIATEDLVHLLEVSGFATGVDLDRLTSTARWLEGVLGVALPGQVMRAGPRWITRQRHAESA